VSAAPLVLGIPTLRRYDLLRTAVTSALAGSVIPQHVIIVDNGGSLPSSVRKTIMNATDHAGVLLDIATPGRNLGVAASWNMIADYARQVEAEHVIITNDDVTCYQRTIARLVDAARDHPDDLFFFPASGGYKNAWSFYLERLASWDLLGPYDEAFYPAYYEDNDRSYRLQLAGKRHVPVAGCGYGHVESATLKAFSEAERVRQREEFAVNRAYYIRKWGGDPGHEQFAVPYNGATRPGDARKG
jgi:GT2 family glycosyltransferase